MDEHLLARLTSFERGMETGFNRIETRLARLERQQANDRVDAAKTSAKVAGLIGLLTMLSSVGGAVMATS